jgi:hypothetical protein
MENSRLDQSKYGLCISDYEVEEESYIRENETFVKKVRKESDSDLIYEEILKIEKKRIIKDLLRKDEEERRKAKENESDSDISVLMVDSSDEERSDYGDLDKSSD